MEDLENLAKQHIAEVDFTEYVREREQVLWH